MTWIGRSSGVLLRVLLAAAFLAWFLLLRPGFLGGPASYVIVSGESMESTLYGGDVAVLQRAGDYGRGDIVAFRVPESDPGAGAIVIHRIVGGSPDEGFVMQGDNKKGPDSWRPTEDDVVGRMWFSMPGAGRFLAFLRAPVILAALAAGIAVFLVLSGPEKKAQGQLSPASPEAPAASRSPRRGRFRPPALPLSLFLVLLLVTATVVAFGARH